MTDRDRARIVGVLYLVTFATSIPGLAVKTAFWEGGSASLAAWGAILEFVLAASCVGTALVLVPIARRVSETLAVGFVVSRTIEATMILTGVLALLAVASLRASGQAEYAPVLVAVHDATFLVGPGVMSAVNALVLGTLVLRGRLVPRALPVVGLAGAVALLGSSTGVMFGQWTQTDPIAAVAAVPIAAWEFGLGVWLIVKGVRSEARVARVAPERSRGREMG